MKVKIVLNADNMTKEDLRSFIQKVREWELLTPRAQIDALLLDTDPQMSSIEALDIFKGIFPEFKHLVEVPQESGSTLRLGERGIAIDGVLIGSCHELTLSIGAAGEAELTKLREAQTIQLVKIAKG